MPELPPSLRTSLADRYDIERELGEGGMATVYLAGDVRHGRKVAIKVIRAEVAATLGTERFLAEIKLTASLQHPHILGLIDSGIVPSEGAAGRPFYVMPYVTGETLRGRLSREGALPIGEAVTLLAEIADALSCAHGQGIVHRDIKPENILLGQGHAMVTDFGIAKAVHRSSDGTGITGTGVSIGTPAYMSPEQAVGDPKVDHRADLYALGIVAYELVTGTIPFTGSSVAAIVTAALTQPAPSLSIAAPTSPPRLAALVSTLLEKDPANRPANAAIVRDALRSIVAELSTSTPATPLIPQPVPRSPRVMLGIVAAVGVMVVAALAVWHPWKAALNASAPRPTAETAGPRSIAVLPFRNVNRDSTTDYFSDGIAEELISALGRLRGLRVASRTSTFAMKGQTGVLAEVGRRLGVGVVLEGSVQREADMVRVTARLVDVARDSVLWDDTYNSQLRNVLFLQDSIARAIVSALSVTLSGNAGGGLARPRTADPDAYQDYIRGRSFLSQRNPSSVANAIRAFESAIGHDSSFAPAYAGLADAYSLAAPFGGRRPRDVFELARNAANRALMLDSTLSEAHTSLGIVAMFYDWDWEAAARHLKRGVELNESSAEGHLFYGWYQLLRGSRDSALAEVAKAHALDRLSVVIATRRGTIIQYQGRDADAIPFFRQALELDSTFFSARVELADALARTGKRDEARRMVPMGQFPKGTGEAGYVGWIFAELGDTTGARGVIRALETASRDEYVAPDAIAVAYAAVGDSARVLDYLEKAAEERAFTLVFLGEYPMFHGFRQNPRFRRIADRVGVVLPP